MTTPRIRAGPGRSATRTFGPGRTIRIVRIVRIVQHVGCFFALFPAVVVLLAGTLVAQAVPGDWWHRDWRFRIPVHVINPAVGPAAHVTLLLGPDARPDAFDLRVVGPAGQPVPHRVLEYGRSHGVTVAFPVAGTWRQQPRYWIYFGNQNSGPAPEPFRGACGPVLEVRQAGPGAIETLDPVRTLFAQSPKVLGCGPVNRVFLGLNPFGPERACVSRITGWIFCPHAGVYTFSVNAVDAAFLEVNGELVVSWGGRHGPEWNSSGRHAGTIALDKGSHAFVFTHASHRRGVFASLGMKRPGEAQLRLAWHDAFLRWAPVAVGRIEARDGGPQAFFCAHHEHDLGLSGRPITTIRFVERVSVAPEDVVKWHWDFGDGVTASGPEPRHVFLTRGTFAVTLDVHRKSGQVLRVTRRVAVHPRGTSGPEVQENVRADAAILDTYPLDRLGVEAGLNAAFVFRAVERFEAAQRVLQAVFSRKPALATPVLAEEAFFLGDWLRSHDPRKALTHYRYVAEQAAREPDRRLAKAWVGALELDLGSPGDVARAETALRALIAEDPRARDDAVRLALIKLADVKLTRGQLASARVLLGRAGRIERSPRFRGDTEVTAGHHLLAFEERMARGDHAGAARALDDWEWAAPLDKMAGTIQFLRVELEAARGRPARALVHLHRLERVNPTSPDLASAWWLAARAYGQAGDRARAMDYCGRILERFPTTLAAQHARAWLAGKDRH